MTDTSATAPGGPATGGGAHNPIGHLVVGGRNKDLEFVRARLTLLFEEFLDDGFEIDVRTDYSDIATWEPDHFAVTYSANLVPTDEQQEQLRDWVTRGGRWFALHGTNAAVEVIDGKVHTLGTLGTLAETVGSEVLADPPEREWQVTSPEPDDLLVRGISEFSTRDQLYLLRMEAEVRPLLETQFIGTVDHYVASDWTTGDGRRVLMYERLLGDGAVLYLSLGHSHAGVTDLVDRAMGMPFERGSWPTPEYSELLRRGIRWAAEIGEFAPAG